MTMRKYIVIYTDGKQDYTYECITNSAESASDACYIEAMTDENGNDTGKYEQIGVIEGKVIEEA